jgi:hypothetical protein
MGYLTEKCFPEQHKAVEMISEKYFIDKTGNFIIRGKCSVCNNNLSRLIEVGNE